MTSGTGAGGRGLTVGPWTLVDGPSRASDAEAERRLNVVVAWWTERFMVADKCEAFREALRTVVERELAVPEVRSLLLDVDHDPKGFMLEAVRAAGVECSGTMFSAKGILPEKATMTITADRVEVRDGRGLAWRNLWARDERALIDALQAEIERLKAALYPKAARAEVPLRFRTAGGTDVELDGLSLQVDTGDNVMGLWPSPAQARLLGAALIAAADAAETVDPPPVPRIDPPTP